MGIPRRRFLKVSALASCAAALEAQLPNLALAQKGDGKSSALPADLFDAVSLFNRSTFAPLVESDFSVHPSGLRTRTLTLTEIRDLPQADGSDARATDPEECFSLLFRDTGRIALKQGSYLIKHPQLGSFALFLVPMKSNGAGSSYEAVFNRADR